MKKPINELFNSEFGNYSCGRMISGSKRKPAGCKCVFNANVITRSEGKIWFGDLNITKEGDKLKNIATLISVGRVMV